MKTIHKQVLGIADEQKVRVASGSKFLSLQTQYGHPTIWYLTDVEPKGEETWTILCFGTGHLALEPPGDFLGTIQIKDGSLIFHYFRKAETAA